MMTIVVTFLINALMTYVVDNFYGCLFNECFDDICGQCIV